MIISTHEVARRQKWTQMILERESRLRLFEQLHQNDDSDWRRASGRAICPHCHLAYRDHPYDEEHPLYGDGHDNRLCDGTVVHL